MILLNPIGGLASQLHKYFVAFALSKKLNTSIKICLDENRDANDRIFELDKFNIPIVYASKIECFYYKCKKNIYRLSKKIGLKKNRYLFKGLMTFETFHTIKNNVYLDNEWILGDIYYREFYSELKSLFLLKEPMTQKAQETLNNIKDTESVSIHFRRGDYLNPNTSAFHGSCSLDYYFQAVQIMIDRVDNPVFFIFSDDINWVKENFVSSYETHFVNYSSHEDIVLMSACKHNIIANSGYSWMAACLNTNDDKKIVAPKYWVLNDEINAKIYSYFDTSKWTII